MTDLEPGDVVQLKSGGPAMTVVAVDGKEARCLWFGEGTNEVQSATIPVIALDRIDLADDDDDLDEDED